MTDISYADLKRANDAALLNAERQGAGVVDAWPSTMVFEFTAACNLHCFMCGFEMLRNELRAKGRTKFTLPVETFRMVADKAFPHIRLINPTVAGESFMMPYFEEFVDKVAEYGCKVELVTNGMLLQGKRLLKLMPHIGILTASIDGATKETFEHIRTGAKFEQVMQNLATFAQLRREMGLEGQIGFNFNVTIMKENVHELPQIVELAASLGVQQVMGTYMIVMSDDLRASSPLNCPAETNRALEEAQRVGDRLGVGVQLPRPLPLDVVIEQETFVASTLDAVDGIDEAESPTHDDAEPPVQESFETAGDLLGAADAETGPATPCASAAADADVEHHSWILGGMPEDWKGKYYCNMPWRRVYIGLGGEMAPCCGPGRPIVGNVFEQDFFEIWNGKEYRKLREGLYSGNLTDYCRQCPYLQQAGSLEYQAAPGS